MKQTEIAGAQFQRHPTPSGMALIRRIFQRSLADFEAYYGHIERIRHELRNRTFLLLGDGEPFSSTTVAEWARAAITDGN